MNILNSVDFYWFKYFVNESFNFRKQYFTIQSSAQVVDNKNVNIRVKVYLKVASEEDDMQTNRD